MSLAAISSTPSRWATPVRSTSAPCPRMARRAWPKPALLDSRTARRPAGGEPLDLSGATSTAGDGRWSRTTLWAPTWVKGLAGSPRSGS